MKTEENNEKTFWTKFSGFFRKNAGLTGFAIGLITLFVSFLFQFNAGFSDIVERIDTRFIDIDERIDNRFSDIDERIDRRLSEVSGKVGENSDALIRLEKDIGHLKENFSELKSSRIGINSNPANVSGNLAYSSVQGIQNQE
ncbi:MAG: hypothetical protein OXF20_05440 [Gammaproteobacteria bacterium]|nr:hypothetical protein [Gammaproteobacteria bacterium]